MEFKSLQWRPWTALALVAALLTGGLGGWLVTASAAAEPEAAYAAEANTVLPASDVYPLPTRQGFQAVVQRTLPAVVSISTTRSMKVESRRLPFFSNDPFGDFFGFGFRGPEGPIERESRGLGSGVIVTPDGYILTNEHVVRDADEIRVSLSDRRDLTATLVGSDPKTDIAILKVDERNLPNLPLGDSSDVQVGDLVLAMGNPFGIGPTVTMGIVSATGRDGLNPEAYEDFIQTDAAINPGNSGGPLVNVDGDLIGINTAIISRSGGNQGIGFAIPSSMALDVMTQILERGRVVRGWLGVSIQPVTSAIADVFELGEPRGALVGSVELDSPAARAGLQVGDVIVGVDGHDVKAASDLRLKVAQAGPDAKVNIRVVRDGKRLELPVTLGELPEAAQAVRQSTDDRGVLSGLQVQELNAQLIRQLNLPADTLGVLVSSVDPNSRAARAGLQRGDVIQEVNRQPVTSVGDFQRSLRSNAESAVLLVNRSGQTRYVVVD